MASSINSIAPLPSTLPVVNNAAPSAISPRNNPNELTEDQQKQLQDLKNRDREVRAHESAHKTVGGPYAGAVTYETQTGPDGREYAIGGETQIDASPVPGKPEATIRKMDIVIRAALAPAEPSSQDYAVARSAQQARLEAQRELSAQQNEESTASPLSNLALLNESARNAPKAIADKAVDAYNYASGL